MVASFGIARSVVFSGESGPVLILKVVEHSGVGDEFGEELKLLKFGMRHQPDKFLHRIAATAIQYASQGLYANEALAAECALLLNQQATRLGQYYLSLAAPGLPDTQKTAAPADQPEAAE